MSKNDTITQVYKVLGCFRIEAKITFFLCVLFKIIKFILLHECIFTVYVDVTESGVVRHIELADISLNC